MAQATLTFNDILEAADALSIDEQETLLDVLRSRMAERRRDRLAQEVARARSELAAGECESATPDEIIAEILS